MKPFSIEMTGARKGRSFGIADGKSLACSPETGQRFFPAQELDALEQAGTHVGAGDGDADRLEGVARLEAEALRQRAQRRLDVLRVERLGLSQRLGRLADDGRA